METSSGNSGWSLWGRHVVLCVLGLAVAWAVLLPARSFKRNDADKSKSVALMVANVLKAYRSEYGRFPPGLGETTAAETGGALVAALSGADTTDNSQGVNFLPELRPLAPGEPGGPGLRRNAAGESVVDAWGRRLHVLVDADGDGFVPNPEPRAPQSRVEASVLVWSGGPDGDPTTWKDNVATWRARRLR